MFSIKRTGLIKLFDFDLASVSAKKVINRGGSIGYAHGVFRCIAHLFNVAFWRVKQSNL
jgi:hypothetical protein